MWHADASFFEEKDDKSMSDSGSNNKSKIGPSL